MSKRKFQIVLIVAMHVRARAWCRSRTGTGADHADLKAETGFLAVDLDSTHSLRHGGELT